MTSPASHMNQNPAPTPSAPATSYASAAGANKKPTQPPVVVGSVPAVQNGKTSSASPLNGRPNITPALPAVGVPPTIVRSSPINGGDHSRKSSVTISANPPPSHIANGGPVGGSKAMPQFGFNESPAISHSSPHPSGAAPIPIPGGNPRVASPAHSPSPIPQMPQQSGGGARAPSSTSAANVTFGSFPGETDRHMKQHSISHPAPGQSPHVRRDSQASAHSEAVGHGGPPHRGGFQGQGRGRGGFNSGYNNQHNQPMGFPPNRPYSGANAGRGGMPYHQGRGGMQQYPNSPQPSQASPAPAPAMPRHTPNLSHASMVPNQQYYTGAMPAMYPTAPVNEPPFIQNDSQFKQGKKGKGARRQPQKPLSNELTHRSRKNSKRWDSGGNHQEHAGNSSPHGSVTDGPPPSYSFAASRSVPMHHSSLLPEYYGPDSRIDLSPANGFFEHWLTEQKKQMNVGYGHGPPLDSYGRPVMPPYQYGQPPAPMQYMPPGQQPVAPYASYAPPYVPGQPTAAPMSRNPSQVSDRPRSSTGTSQAPAIAQGTPTQHPAQPAPPVVVSSTTTFSRPKKSAAITIKDAQGKIVDLSSVNRPPASPSPSIQQSKTPPVVASTPTPPPKPTTPAHGRTDSDSAASLAAIRNEFKDAVRKAVEVPTDSKAKEEEAAEKAAAEEKAKEEERVKEEERLAAEKKAAEKKAAEDAKAAEEAAKAKERAEAEAKAKAEAEAKTKADAEAAEKAAKEAAEAKTTAESEEDEMERMIREMEEEDARREKEQAEITARKKAEAEERKKLEEANKAATAAENDKKLREQELEMERLEEERERKRKEAEASGGVSVAELLTKKMDELEIADKKEAPAPSKPETVAAKMGLGEKKGKPVPLTLSPISTKPVEAPQPSAALQSLKTSRFLPGVEYDIYPAGIQSPNPALNNAVAKKGKVFKYDAQFLLQFQGVFTEQPSMEFQQQVKSLIGESDGNRSASARTPSSRGGSRPGPSGGFPQQGAMGQFGASKTLPPGTTSEQRFAMSQGTSSMPRPSIGGMAFGRPGAFPGQLSRTPSSTNAAGIPHSPRQGSRRGGSKRADMSKGDAQAAKTMPLTAGIEVKPITTSSTGWKPISIGRPSAAVAQPGHMDPEMVQRKVKAALNKMTPEKFDKISDGILEIASQSKNEQDGRTLRQVIQLTFEKATDEAHWASMYAKFCKRMLETMSPDIRDENITDKNGNVVSGGALFRKYLLNRCQEEFERGWKVDLPEVTKSGKPGEAELLSDEYYIAAAAKRRGLGLVQFIGELFKLGMLTERIMHECVRKLLEFQGIPDEAEIESLTKLLRTVGAVLDSSEKGRHMMEVYFQRINGIVDLPELPSRLKFMLMDIIDLRKARWASKDANKGPKTLEEVRAEAELQAAQKAAESARNSQRGGPGGRPGGGRGDTRSFSQYNQAPPNQVQMDDLRRLKATGGRSASQTTTSFGPSSFLSSRSNSGRRSLAPGGAFGRSGEDSGASSRTGTPPTRDSVAHTNAFGLLADTGENPASPPSTAASPALSKAALDNTAASSNDKKE
ncbi:hypothetical protein QBC47DRAFT_91328 [Echria macrotheca]|uniref:MIF4G domain-containing protein n=1 Tax=Echria macrotheca TaxID=438768 RepID=A0AAJ0B2U0_9PEZI|nr:hypothetical protein QBC47DRAFT_91328 [Echria macrotheca]